MAYTPEDLQQRGYYFDGATQTWINPATKNVIPASQVDASGTAAGIMSQQTPAAPVTDQVAPSPAQTPTAPSPSVTSRADQTAQRAPVVSTQETAMGQKVGMGAAGGAATGAAAGPWGAVIGAGIGAIGGAMEGGEGGGELKKEAGREKRLKNDLVEMSRAEGETAALPVRTQYPVLSGLPSGPFRAPQRAAWALTYGLGENSKKPSDDNLEYLRTAPATPQSIQAARYRRMQAAENRLRLAKLVIYPLALGALLL